MNEMGIEERLLEILSMPDSWWTNTDIMDQVPASQVGEASQKLRKLEIDGLIYSRGVYTYRITDRGKRRLAELRDRS
jgi:hypothetical protein